MTFNQNSSKLKRILHKVRESIIKPEGIRQLRGDVYLITVQNSPPLILKGFNSYDKWYRQLMVLSLLKKSGFRHTYQMYKDPHPFQIDGMWYGFIEYLPMSSHLFSFSNHSDRIEGARLLENFHNCADHIYFPLPSFNQIRKWQDRLDLFRQNSSAIRTYMTESMLKEWIAWGEWSLKGLIANQSYILKEKSTILHGDCAHHNFLRKKDGILALIDFDLISKGPRLYDYLQYANRILPHLNDPAKEVWDYSQIKAYQANPAFLYALAFPSDIFREWNLVLKTSTHLNHVWKISVADFEKRMSLNKSLKYLVK